MYTAVCSHCSDVPVCVVTRWTTEKVTLKVDEWTELHIDEPLNQPLN